MKTITGGARTMMVRSSRAVPPGPLAVSRYVVVVSGATRVEPESPRSPMPWLMETLVAFVTCHESVVSSPSAIVRREAVNEIAGFGGVTVSVACRTVVPPVPVAVSV